MSQGKVYLVGSGPGDPELITMKGYRLLISADAVLSDQLVPKELLRLVKKDAEVIPVGKFAGKHTLPQEEINTLLVEKAKQGKMVVRLKGGDPYLFGRGGEEAVACAEAGVDFEVVPGVTSAFAAPCYAGIPPTHRDYTSTVAVITGHRKAGDDRPIEIPKAGTVIFLMSVSNLKNIIQTLLKDGWPGKTKIAAVENGTFYNQRVITGTLDGFFEKTQQEKLKTPAIFIVGKVVELNEKLNWFSKKPNVLVLGNHPEKYQHLGNIVHRRIIDCVPIEDYSEVDDVIKSIAEYDWIVFTSVNGAKYFFERLNIAGSDTRLLASAKVAAIGRTTAGRLKEFGIISDLVPENESSAGLLEEFSKLDMSNKKVLLPQAEVSSKELPDGLLNMNADIKKITVYKTIDKDPGQIDFDFIDQILFTSGSTVRAFVKHSKEVPSHIKVYGLGQPTLNVAKKHSIIGEIIPSNASD